MLWYTKMLGTQYQTLVTIACVCISVIAPNNIIHINIEIIILFLTFT